MVAYSFENLYKASKSEKKIRQYKESGKQNERRKGLQQAFSFLILHSAFRKPAAGLQERFTDCDD